VSHYIFSFETPGSVTSIAVRLTDAEALDLAQLAETINTNAGPDDLTVGITPCEPLLSR
jgi:hypothetical protein